MTTAIIIDTETTDKEGDLEVIEMACCDYGNPKDSFRQLYRPERGIKYGALAVHHILPSDLVRCLPSSSAQTDVPLVDYWIGHNIDFDWKALGSPPVKRICTLALARRLWPELDSHTLVACMYFTQGVNDQTRKIVKGAHSALDDVYMCNQVLMAIINFLGTTNLHNLWEESEDARIPRTMTFGKHKGKTIAEVDRGYSNWYRKQSDPDPYLLEAFKRAGI